MITEIGAKNESNVMGNSVADDVTLFQIV